MQNDWSLSFAAAARLWLAGYNPYTAPVPFASPPWTLFILAPLVQIPAWAAMLLPALALVFCAYRLRKPRLIALVGLSFPFTAAVVYANIDWMVMVGVVIGGPLGVILNTVKPQAGVFANVALLARCKTWRKRLTLVAPLIALALLTLPLYADWLTGMRTVSYDTGTVRNFSLFPYSIPAGVIALVLAWRRKSVIWGVVASLALAPYFYVHSLLPLLLLVADSNWRAGLLMNAALWGLLALILAGIVPMSL